MPSTDPRFKLILTYDVQQDMQDTYLQFMLGELVPAVQSLGLQMTGAWHTASRSPGPPWRCTSMPPLR